MLKEAMLYKKMEDDKVSCFLCSHRCLIERYGFSIQTNQIREGRCSQCGNPVDGVGL